MYSTCVFPCKRVCVCLFKSMIYICIFSAVLQMSLLLFRNQRVHLLPQFTQDQSSPPPVLSVRPLLPMQVLQVLLPSPALQPELQQYGVSASATEPNQVPVVSYTTGRSGCASTDMTRGCSHAQVPDILQNAITCETWVWQNGC